MGTAEVIGLAVLFVGDKGIGVIGAHAADRINISFFCFLMVVVLMALFGRMMVVV